MKSNRLLGASLAFVLIAGLGTPAFAETILYAVDRDSDVLRVLDRTDASTVTSVTITLAGETVDGALGAAIDPTTGTLWAILKIPGDRVLVTIDPATGVATSIGILDDSYAGLEFASDGILYGVTGDGATVSETFYILSKTDATSTFVCALGNGTDGETIINADGIWYHWSGHFPGAIPDPDYIMEIIDLNNSCATTDIPISTVTGFIEEIIAGAYCPEFDQLIVAEQHISPSTILTVSPAGVATLIGVIDDSIDSFTVAGLACTGDEMIVGGELLPIDSTALMLAGLQTPAVWMISMFSALGIGAFLLTRNPYNVRNIKVILRDYLDRL